MFKLNFAKYFLMQQGELSLAIYGSKFYKIMNFEFRENLLSKQVFNALSKA
jgi:ABC-type uncharacterized transport system substrate-binding protein